MDERARSLILEHGWNSTCYQILNKGIEHWFSSDGGAVVGFVRSGRFAIVAGAPVCEERRLHDVLGEWESFANGRGLRACYFGAEGRLTRELRSSANHVEVVLGSQPEWTPTDFVDAFESDPSLRCQASRARNKDVTLSEWSRAAAENSPRLRSVLLDWLESRGLPPLHFLVEPETLGDMRDRRMFVAEVGDRVVGFVALCPVPAQNGWLTEQFVRSPRAPNGTVELMLDCAARALVGDDADYLTMGMVPLEVLGFADPSTEPPWLRRTRGWAYAHTTRFYNFRGLANFKTKFHPSRWQPVMVIVQANRFLPAHLRAIARAFTGCPPELALARGAVKAVRMEIGRCRKSLRL